MSFCQCYWTRYDVLGGYIIFSLLSLFILPLIGSINSESFPEVLTNEEEKHYLELWSKKDFTARSTLIEHNLRLVAHIVKKYEHSNVDKDDLLSIGAYGLILNQIQNLQHTQLVVLKMKY